MEGSIARFPSSKVLYLDDNVETSALVKSNLERLGVIVDLIYSKDDIVLSEIDNYSLIISAYRLSGSQNGLDVIREIRKVGHSCDCILVTSVGDESILSEALRAGVIEVATKNDIFLENLLHVVSRALELRARKEEILSEKLRTKAFSLLGDILESAKIDHWVYDELNPTENRFPIHFFKKLGIELKEFSSFWKAVSLKQRFRFFREVGKARKTHESFEVMISLGTNSIFWFRVRGVFDPRVKGRAYGIILDETNSVLNEKKLAEALQQREEISKRLQLAVVEIHHRVKNSFQMMISLLNMQLRGKDILDRDAVNNISSHLYGLSSIHDLLTAEAGDSHSPDEINLAELLEKLAVNLPLNSSERVKISCEAIYVSPRVASTFVVIATELLMNAIKHGTGIISIDCMIESDNFCKVIFTNLTDHVFPEADFEKSIHGAGTNLVKFLSKADLKNEANWSTEGKKVMTTFNLPAIRRACRA